MRVDARQNRDHLLAVAREALADGGADASLRDIARTAGVGLGTLYRHYPTREALLEALLHASFDDLAAQAVELERADDAAAALVDWIGRVIEVAVRYRGAIRSMVAAIEDEGSALHAACTAMKGAGARLLARAQDQDRAREDMDGIDLFGLIGALCWMAEQPALAERRSHIVALVTDGILGAVMPNPKSRA